MVEIRRGTDGAHGPAHGGERLPWLEPVEDEDAGDYGPAEQPPGGYGGVVLAGIAVLVAIALVTAGISWWRHRSAATADIGAVIHPEPGPYKVRPPNPGGLDTSDVGVVAAGTGAGEDIDSVLDLNALPEAPVALPRKPARTMAAPQASAPGPAPVEAMPAPTPEPAEADGTVQLGAFSTEGKAKAAWKALSSRFAALRDMTPVIAQIEAGERKLFRLRATGGMQPAERLCAQLRVAGESCAVAGR